MIVADSSVLIGLIRNHSSPQVRRLRYDVNPDEVIVGDLVLVEVLRGARDDRHASRLSELLSEFAFDRMLDREIAIKAASNYRLMRSLGFTMDKTTDLIIGTYCIERGHRLLHQDRDFDPMVEHLGLHLA